MFISQNKILRWCTRRCVTGCMHARSPSAPPHQAALDTPAAASPTDSWRWGSSSCSWPVWNTPAPPCAYTWTSLSPSSKHTHRQKTISVQLNFIRGVLFCSNCNKLAGIDTKCNKSWEWNQRVKQANRTCRVRREINVRDRLYRDVIFIDVFYILYAVFNSLAQRQLYLCRASKEI